MELYKFISETEIKKYKGGFVVVDNTIYTNPKEEIIRMAGYKELIDTPIPEYNPEIEYIVLTYQDGEKITPCYTVNQIEFMEELEVIE